jgi:cytochrome d ubiquinol oxidase subunit I
MIDAAARDTIPRVAPMFWSFRLMVGMGMAMLLLFGWAFWASLKGDSSSTARLLKLALYCLPLPWLSCELGWVVAEYGRQPWTIYGVLPTRLSVSTLSIESLYGSLAGLSVSTVLWWWK